PPLHTLRRLRRRHINRIFAGIYSLVVLSLLYHHLNGVVFGPNSFSSFLLFIADVVLAYMWSAMQPFRLNPVVRQEFPENLRASVEPKDFPPIDVFIFTADPYKEPPTMVVNTALSVMAYDYPPEKLSIYVSDDGGSELTMFAFMEAANFAKIWLPFCRENNVQDASPEAYFNSTNYAHNPQIKKKYEDMKSKVETAVARRRVTGEHISGEDERRILSQFSGDGFARQNHPTVIQVLLDSRKDKVNNGGPTPNLIYVSREKSKAVPHHFKAGAINTLLRVSATMTNSPIILLLDCDMYSNDPSTAQRALCYFNSKPIWPNRKNFGYIQFPQRYQGLTEADIYGCEYKMPFRINPRGLDGLSGSNFVGTNGFFRRRIFFGGPSSYIQPEIDNLDPFRVVEGPIDEPEVLEQARFVARSDYENRTKWGSEIGFRYGSLVEDYYTSYRLLCEGWESIFCDPKRAAFLGDVPKSLMDMLAQNKRWCIGLLEVGFSKFSPLTYGIKSMGFLMAQCFAHYAFWPMWCIPIIIYAFYPSIALIKGIPIFPKVNDAWFLVYIFLFVGSYGQDCFEYISNGSTVRGWWNNQRIWLIRGLSSFLFGLIDYISIRLGLTALGFSLTSKVENDEQKERYERGILEFGVASPMFVPAGAAALLNLLAFVWGSVRWANGGEVLTMEILAAGFGVANGLPFYEAMFFRRDEGRILRETLIGCLVVV
ncbi:hypothetical protein M569_02596, partial [Genlisea aurea]